MTRTPETVRSQGIRALFEQGAAVLWANVGVSVVVVGTLWSEVPHDRLLLWLAAALGLSAVRAALQQSYRRAQPADDAIEAWGRRFVFGSVAAGMLWGAAGLLFFVQGDALSQSLLTFTIGGMTAAAAGTLSCHLPAFFGYFVCALAPLCVRAFAEGDRVHLGMGAMLLAYAAGMQHVARNNHAALAGAFRLAIEKAELSQRLSTSQIELEETNRTLELRVVERTKALEEQGEALRQAQRLEVAGRLAGGLAHDFNSLLTVIMNNAVLMKETQALDEHGKMAAGESLEAAERGAALIRQLLAFSRQKRPEPRVFSLNQLVEEWASLLRRSLGHGVTMLVELAAQATTVCADPAQVEQVLVNLFASARSVLHGGGRMRIATRATSVRDDAELATGDYVELVLEYAGTSAPSGAAKRAFEPYFVFDADLPERPALAAVHAVVKQWGGRLLVESEHESGACFRVLLPASAEALSAPAAARPALAQGAPRSATILVVDDEPTLRSVIRRNLVREGYSVLVAEDGERALALAKSHESAIDLLITDVVMPGLTGLQLARQLLLVRPRLGVLFISGYTFEESIPANDLATRTAYLPKPFDTKVLTTKVHELLQA